MYEHACAECEMQVGVCYKCKTREDLSKKSKHLMICRPCRNRDAKEYKSKRYIANPIPYNDYIDHLDKEAWKKNAYETAHRISMRFKNG